MQKIKEKNFKLMQLNKKLDDVDYKINNFLEFKN